MSHEVFMEAALEQARLALDAGEVPIGAVLVIKNEIVARAYNQPISGCDPTAHAEVLVLRAAARSVGNYRLTDADVYVTLEPCLMCVGALVHARVRAVIYAAVEPKTGALISAGNLRVGPNLRHLHAYLVENRCIESLRDYNEGCLSIFSRDILAKIRAGDSTWENAVPPQVATIIKERRLFNYQSK